MLLPSLKYGIMAFLLTGTAVFPAVAGLYGFNSANPYTSEEKILDMKYLPTQIRNYRAAMRENLQMLIDYAHKNKPDFRIIVHEGQELLYRSSWEDACDGYNLSRRQKGSINDTSFLNHGKQISLEPKPDTPEYKYLHSVDAVAVNNLYCGSGKEHDITFNHNLGLISIDHCPSEEAAEQAVVRSVLDKKILYVFTNLDQAFSNIASQPLINDSARNVGNVDEAGNILLMTDDSRYTSKDKFVQDLSRTNYDIIVIKPLFAHRQRFSPDDIRRMQFKKNGSRRLLIAEMNVSEASPQDYFWHKNWKIGQPSWLVRKSFVDRDSVITKYWNENWRRIISGHFKDILATGFDGVFFTGVQNHLYFEQQTPLE